MEWQARKEMTTLLSGVIKQRRAEQASGTSTVEKTDLLQVSRILRYLHVVAHHQIDMKYRRHFGCLSMK